MATWSVLAHEDSILSALTAPDTNFGTNTSGSAVVTISGGSKANYTRTVMNFDVSSYAGLADGSDIVSAKLVLTIVTVHSPGEQVNFDRVKGHPDTDPADWVELEVTWNDYSTGNAWTASGGDLDTSDRVTFLVPSTAFKTYDIPGFKDMVVDALNNADRGDLLSVCVRCDDEADSGSTRGFGWYSEDSAQPGPKLVITYNVATGVPAAQAPGVVLGSANPMIV